VYGGGNVGLMGVVANSVLEGGGEIIGIMPHHLIDKEVAHTGLTELIAVSSMHERKAKMISLADGFIALPGGVGTLEEIIEAFVWSQLGLHTKPCGLLNVNGFYDSLIGFLRTMSESRFLKEEQRSQLILSTDPTDLVERLLETNVQIIDKWIDRE